MRHEDDVSEEIKRAMEEFAKEQIFGATGKFPGGRLTSHDEGEIAFGVTIYRGKVVVNFGKPIASLGMSPGEARQLALTLRQRANQIERDQS